MFPCVVLPVLLGCVTVAAPPEPDGSRTLGIVPPIQREPAPPTWLRPTSHVLAAAGLADCRHYLYEAYADGDGGWLVRYVRFPETGDPLETQQAFLFTSDPLAQPGWLACADIRFSPASAQWQAIRFVLVDRRDLLR